MNPQAPQGHITKNFMTSKNEFINRKHNSNNIGDQSKVLATSTRVYQYGGTDSVHTIQQCEILLSWIGPKGIDRSSGKTLVFTDLNGIVIPAGMTLQDLLNTMQIAGFPKTFYAPLDSSVPSNGVAGTLGGTVPIFLNTDCKRIFYPGEFLVISLPSPKDGLRVFPTFRDLQREKILPLLRPFDYSLFKNFNNEIHDNSYKGNALKSVQLYDSVDIESNVPLTPFLRNVHRKKRATITMFMRMLEICAKRGDITINIDPSRNKKTMVELMDDRDVTNDNEINEKLHNFAISCGLLPSYSDGGVGITKNTPMDPQFNELQKEIFTAAMWPNVNEVDHAIFKPNIRFSQNNTPTGNVHLDRRQSSVAASIKENNNKYTRFATSACADFDRGLFEQKMNMATQVAGMIIDPTDSNAQNPRANLLAKATPQVW
jgi:hypothetical protein